MFVAAPAQLMNGGTCPPVSETNRSVAETGKDREANAKPHAMANRKVFIAAAGNDLI